MSNEPSLGISAEGSIFDKDAANRNRAEEFKAGVVGVAQTSDKASVDILQGFDEVLRAERQKLAVEARRQDRMDAEQMGQSLKGVPKKANPWWKFW